MNASTHSGNIERPLMARGVIFVSLMTSMQAFVAKSTLSLLLNRTEALMSMLGRHVIGWCNFLYNST